MSTYSEEDILFLPAGPGYRKEKEIKNVITAIAKTTHYWTGHMYSAQQSEIGELFRKMDVESPLLQPPSVKEDLPAEGHEQLGSKIGERIAAATGLLAAKQQYAGWLGVKCPDVRSAVWMTRAMVASNVLARREGTTLFVPVNAESDPAGDTVTEIFARIHQFAKIRKML